MFPRVEGILHAAVFKPVGFQYFTVSIAPYVDTYTVFNSCRYCIKFCTDISPFKVIKQVFTTFFYHFFTTLTH